jgi:hypothetical protein
MLYVHRADGGRHGKRFSTDGNHNPRVMGKSSEVIDATGIVFPGATESRQVIPGKARRLGGNGS